MSTDFEIVTESERRGIESGSVVDVEQMVKAWSKWMVV